MADTGLKIKELVGGDIQSIFDELAPLRIQVFKEFPYLYLGNLDYERAYLDVYFKSIRSYLLAVYDGPALVGATTCIPLVDETEEVQQPFLAATIDPQTVFYFGESILLPAYRGRGVGHLFFDAREKWSYQFPEITCTAFCAVDRPDDHPLRPVGYQPHDSFWTKRGYQRQINLKSVFHWRDLDEPQESGKSMTYWLKARP